MRKWHQILHIHKWIMFGSPPYFAASELKHVVSMVVTEKGDNIMFYIL